ncbi:hypothetical protein OROMI_015281 [Orobanche minor]
MAAQVYNVLRQTRCPLCYSDFEDGMILSFHGPCWRHPMCVECRDYWRNDQLEAKGLYPTCPHCQDEYDLFDEFMIKLQPWHQREDVDYPSQPDGPIGAHNLAGHEAPCCGKGYKGGDHVIASPCSGGQIHWMHSWCFLVLRMPAEGNSLLFNEQPFNCYTCGGQYAPTNTISCHVLDPEPEPDFEDAEPEPQDEAHYSTASDGGQDDPDDVEEEEDGSGDDGVEDGSGSDDREDGSSNDGGEDGSGSDGEEEGSSDDGE